MIEEMMAAIFNEYEVIRKHWPALSSIIPMFPTLCCEIDKLLEICRILDEDNAISLSLVYLIANGETLKDDRAMLYGFMNVREEREDQNDIS